MDRRHMLNIHFKRNSQPINDDELLSVIDGIRQARAADHHQDKVYALLLSKMVFRINALQQEIAKLRNFANPELRYDEEEFASRKTAP